jgi:hypothetical protein
MRLLSDLQRERGRLLGGLFSRIGLLEGEGRRLLSQQLPDRSSIR